MIEIIVLKTVQTDKKYNFQLTCILNDNLNENI